MLGEVTDSTWARGTAGIYTASNPTDVTNILVFGTAFAVEPKGKRPTFWGT